MTAANSPRRPSLLSLAVGATGGLLNVTCVLALFARGSYPVLDSPTQLTVLALAGFTLGFVALFIASYTRLLTPAVGFLAVLAGTVSLELTTPLPEWGELGGYVIVDGPTHVSSYAHTWYVWLSLVVVAGLVEFGLRRGYGVGDGRLRNLPSLPLSRSGLGRTVATAAGLVGLATALLVLRAGIRPAAVLVFVVFVVATAVAAVPLVALLSRGLVVPIALFALVPYALAVEVFVTTDSPVHILLFGPYALLLLATAVVEYWLRANLSGWDGGQFVDRQSA
ncbi:hypothetical protein C482_18427 [Natrialba chahannaoensis JCM 10990]|uniref:Uncharacterized protein n=1 Tax=Natrialba chahannaoensis JCM 10990 TaxID=1227492 RepID=M0A8U4_9EURY|nr:hypothetical protein [Natrialba chahannaoensis]ELY94312.1 hypothetical protein C482_18427 [Natrialba chahannaoensis JCM 10990]